MKTPSRIVALAVALLAAAALAPAGTLTITANVTNGPFNAYDSVTSIPVSSGGYCSYYMLGGTTCWVHATGPGVSINDTIHGGYSNGGGSFTSSGNFSAEVFAESLTVGGTAHSELTVVW